MRKWVHPRTPVTPHTRLLLTGVELESGCWGQADDELCVCVHPRFGLINNAFLLRKGLRWQADPPELTHTGMEGVKVLMKY